MSVHGQINTGPSDLIKGGVRGKETEGKIKAPRANRLHCVSSVDSSGSGRNPALLLPPGGSFVEVLRGEDPMIYESLKSLLRLIFQVHLLVYGIPSPLRYAASPSRLNMICCVPS